MSRADRNKHMINARNQWASTKDGAITHKTADINHAYAVGFSDGIKLNSINTSINDYIQSQIAELSTMSVIEMLLHTTTDSDDTMPERKDDLLSDINAELGTNYQRKHMDNWIAGRADTPKRVMQIVRRNVFTYLLGDAAADNLKSLY